MLRAALATDFVVVCRIAIGEPEGAALQRRLLQREGVAFDERGLISLSRFAWLPR